MALDRQSIEKRDFPIGRRGYEPEAVDTHLAELADQIEQLQRAAQRRSGASLAQAASEQVRSIVEAAEQSAAAIERDAESEAQRIRQEAQRDAEKTDSDAVERSREHVAKVGEQSGMMLQRVDAIDTELASLLETLRTTANRLKADLSLLDGSMDDLYSAAGGQRGGGERVEAVASTPVPASTSAPAPAAEAPSTPAPPVEPEPIASEAAETPAAVEPEPEAEPPRVTRTSPTTPGSTAAAETGGDEEGGDVEGARLIALNMALNGQSRDETDRYLAENFDLADRESLLDEVYESVGS
jgi:hypothetical protein